MHVVVWFFWILLFFSWPLDFLVAAFQPSPEAATEPGAELNSQFVRVLAVAAVVELLLAVFFRWLFFRFLMAPHRLRPGAWTAGAVGIFGALLVFSLIKIVEISGFILWLQSHSWRHFLLFSAPSFICFLVVIPTLLFLRTADRDSTKNHPTPAG